MDSSYGPLLAAHVAKTLFRLAIVAFVIGGAIGALIMWWIISWHM